MKMISARGIAACLLLLAVACREEKDDAPPGPTPVDVKLDQHARQLELLKQRQIEVVKVIEEYEKAHAAYLAALRAQMAAAKASARAITQAQEMEADGDRIAKELLAAVQQAHQQLLDRADAASRLLRTDGQLWGIEQREFQTRDIAAQKAQAEIAAMHDARTELHVAQKKQQEALVAMTDGEFDAWQQVESEPKMRDVTDGKLDELRAALEAAYNGLLDASLHEEAATDKVHRRLLGLTVHKVRVAKMQSMVDARAAAATTLQRARKALKEAMVKRAEARKQEIAYDGEYAIVVDGAFAKAKDKETFLAKVKPQRDAALAARQKMREAEKALTESRKQLATLEADIQGMGY